MKSDKDVGAGATGTVDRRLAATRRAARVRAAALGELAIEKAKLSRQIAELEQSNSRLEELAGAVTHDLSEGLATISMFVEALESRLGGGLDPAAARDLNGIRAGLERMNLLVSEELNAARVGGRTGAVDSQAALSAALSNLEARISESDSQIVAERLPWVICDRAELTRLFQNLLANSLAARDPDRDLLIRVSARPVGLRWHFEVEDTGAGIRSDLVGQLDEPTGPGAERQHGLGLVICRRIVEAHGGTIRAARRAGGGTTVCFDLLAGNEPGSGLGRPAPPGAA
jgi:signal transduction histidine kinase